VSVKAGASWSNVGDAFEAGQEAATLAMHQIGEDTADLALVFSSPMYSKNDLLEGVRAVVGRTPLLGCTDAGSLTREGPVQKSVAVMLVRASGLEIRPGAGDKLSADPEEAGRAMAQQALDGRLGSGSGPGTLLLTFCEGARGNLSAVLRGAQKVVGERFPIVGAAAGDDQMFTDTSQYCLSYLLKDSTVGFLLGGSVKFGVGTRHGWTPISRPRTVTRAEGAELLEIDGRPAAECYREYLGREGDEVAHGTLARVAALYPLGFSVDGEEEALVRFPVRATEAGGLQLSGEVPQNAQVRVMLGTRVGVIDSARKAAGAARDSMGPAVVRAAVVFSNFARGKVMGRDAAQEMRAIREVLGENVPVVGFYSYGELAPPRLNGERHPTQYRNDSIVVLTVGEGPG
jgi:hypothetical protein